MTFSWSPLAVPYAVCCAAMASVAIAAALVRGDRVLRLGLLGAGITGLPWTLCQALCACTDDAALAERLERLGNGPLALCGPCMLLVLLAAGGLLERFRWVARISALLGTAMLAIEWSTPWMVAGVQRLSSGMFYIKPGPLMGLHLVQLIGWTGVGLTLMRVSSPRAERRQTQRLVLAVGALAGFGALDTFVLVGKWHSYPLAWLPATCVALSATYLIVRTDLVRPRGVDRGVALELVAFGLSVAATAGLACVIGSPIALALAAGLVWAMLTAIAWRIASHLPVRIPGARSLEQFVAGVAALDDPAPIAQRLAALWQHTLKIPVRRASSIEGSDVLVEIPGGARRVLDPDLAHWFARHPAPLAVSDLATMRLGAMRGKLEALGADHPAALIVPLVDRDELVGLVEADRETALQDAERDLVARSARAAARALTFAALSRAAGRERETAREVEIADALRLQASASRAAAFGDWTVAAEYRSAPRSTGAGWSAALLPDGRLALLVTEAQAPGVAAALATSALAGAFAAATVPGAAPLAFAELAATLRASAEGMTRGGQPVGAFVAILDAGAHELEWACAGHPGACVLAGSPLAFAALGGDRGTASLPDGAVLVVASTGLRGGDAAAWEATLVDYAASERLASALVDRRLRGGAFGEDLLAVVVRR